MIDQKVSYKIAPVPLPEKASVKDQMAMTVLHNLSSRHDRVEQPAKIRVYA